jgi:single-stranded-DNA-specific exonuclease
MSKLAKRWVVLPKKSDDLVTQLLINRGIDPKDKEKFLNPDYSRDLFDPYRLPDMEKAVKRFVAAIKNKETIGIYGDYDHDGTPAAALLFDLVSFFEGCAKVFIPSREEGYGLHTEAIKDLAKNKVSLLITVDCGIRNAEEVKLANDLGMDVLILDHHETPKKMPPALAVVDPKRPDSKYPVSDLSACGLAWKFAQALTARLSEISKKVSKEEYEKFLKWELDLVAIATVADVIPLTSENRVMVKFGMITLAKTRRPGLRALYEVAALPLERMGTYAINFIIAPRINAPGRMDHANQSFYLLTTQDSEEARKLAAALDRINKERQRLLDRVMREARAAVSKGKLHEKKVILIAGERWPHGVVGLVAGKLAEEFARPVIVFEKGKIRSRGSARSIDSFHIVEALDHVSDVLLKHGGHAKAAGLTLETKHLETLYDRLLELAETKISDSDLQPTLSIDAELSPSEVTDSLYETLQKFEPHGFGNSRPHFLGKEVQVQDMRNVGVNGRHLKLKVDGKGAIAFDLAERAAGIVPGDLIDVVYSIDRDEWNGRSRLQLKVLDLKKSG